MAGSRPEAKAKRDKKKTALLIIWRCGDDDQEQSRRCTRIDINTDVKGVFAVMPDADRIALLLWNVMRFCEKKELLYESSSLVNYHFDMYLVVGGSYIGKSYRSLEAQADLAIPCISKR